MSRLARADGAARADLARAAVHVEGGEAEDAERAEDQHQAGHHGQRDGHQRVAGVAAALRSPTSCCIVADHAIRIALAQRHFDRGHDAIDLAGLHADEVLRRRIRPDARRTASRDRPCPSPPTSRACAGSRRRCGSDGSGRRRKFLPSAGWSLNSAVASPWLMMATAGRFLLVLLSGIRPSLASKSRPPTA